MKNLINNFIQSGVGEWVACVLLGVFWFMVAGLLAGWLSTIAEHPYGAY
jgi:hypothetical protein